MNFENNIHSILRNNSLYKITLEAHECYTENSKGEGFLEKAGGTSRKLIQISVNQ